MEVEVGDIIAIDGQQHLLSTDQSSNYLCLSNDVGIVTGVCLETNQVEIMLGGEVMIARPQQIKKMKSS